jgi:hypothetical protein
MLVDTDVLIWYMRGNDKAFEAIESLDGFFISVVTYMELVQGMRNKKELNSLRRALRGWNAKVFLVEEHFLSHSMELADALIGASAIANGLRVLTGNDRHYKAIRDLQVQKFTP